MLYDDCFFFGKKTNCRSNAPEESSVVNETFSMEQSEGGMKKVESGRDMNKTEGDQTTGF